MCFLKTKQQSTYNEINSPEPAESGYHLGELYHSLSPRLHCYHLHFGGSPLHRIFVPLHYTALDVWLQFNV